MNSNKFITKIMWLVISIILAILGVWLLYDGITNHESTHSIVGLGILIGEVLFFRWHM